jgi:hypothetical protein
MTNVKVHIKNLDMFAVEKITFKLDVSLLALATF